jgi:hypothetical protein
MTIVQKMGDAAPPPFKKFYVLALELPNGRSLTTVIPKGFEVQPKKAFRDRYWEAHKVHTEMAAACKAAHVPLPCDFVVVNAENVAVAIGRHHVDNDAHDRAFIDVAIFEIFLSSDDGFPTRTGMSLDGVLSAEQQQDFCKATGADYIGRTPADTLH